MEEKELKELMLKQSEEFRKLYEEHKSVRKSSINSKRRAF